jgi:beta-xylosidase
MVLLGVRPHGGTPGWHVLGRETFLVPVTWSEGWPVVGELSTVLAPPPWPLREPAAPPVRDDFDSGQLAPAWVSLRSRPAENCSTKERAGWLSLRAAGESLDDPEVTFVGRRQQHVSCRARVLVDPAEGRGGLAVRLDEEHHYEIEVTPGEVRVLSRVGPFRSQVASRATGAGPVVLRIETAVTGQVSDARQGPDTVSLGIEDPRGAFTALAALDGRYLSTEVAGGFTGRVIGMYAAAGTVHFDWFDYEPAGPDEPDRTGSAD